MTKITLIRTAPISTTGKLEEPGWSGDALWQGRAGD